MQTIECLLSYVYTKEKNIIIEFSNDNDISFYNYTSDYNIWESPIYLFFDKYLFLQKHKVLNFVILGSYHVGNDLVYKTKNSIFNVIIKLIAKLNISKNYCVSVAHFIVRLCLIIPINIYLLILNFVCMIILLEYNNPFDCGNKEGFSWSSDIFVNILFSYKIYRKYNATNEVDWN